MHGLCVISLVENIAKKNRSHFLIAVLLTSLLCNCYTTAYLFFYVPTDILGIWGLAIYQWKGLENDFPRMYFTP